MVALHDAKWAVIQPSVMSGLFLVWLDHDDGGQALTTHAHLGWWGRSMVSQLIGRQPSRDGRGERAQQDDQGSRPDHPAKVGAGA